VAALAGPAPVCGFSERTVTRHERHEPGAPPQKEVQR